MPLAQEPVVTTTVVSSGEIVEKWLVELPANFTGSLTATIPIVTQNLNVKNLPKLWAWIQQISGPAGVTFQPMFSVASRTGDNGDSEPEWLPFTPEQMVMAFGVPTEWNCICRFPVYAFGVRFTNPNAELSVRMTVVLGACQ